MATDTGNNLPVLAVRTGGALVKVLSELERHATKPLDRRAATAISRIVTDLPELNTEARVSMLVDLVSFHGEKADSWLARMFEDFNIEVVYLAIDYLYEAGYSDRKSDSNVDNSNDHQESLRSDIEELCDLIERLQRLVGDDITVQGLNVYILRVGLAGASSMDDDLLARSIAHNDGNDVDDE